MLWEEHGEYSERHSLKEICSAASAYMIYGG